MTHPTRDMLDDFRDGDLSPEQHVDVFQHTATCAECQAYLARAAELVAQFEAISAVPIVVPDVDESYERFLKHAPPDLFAPRWRERVEHRLRPFVADRRDRDDKSHPQKGTIVRWVAGAASVAAVGMAAYYGNKAWRHWRSRPAA